LELKTIGVVLFGNPLKFLPEILPLSNLQNLSLANVRIKSKVIKLYSSVNVQIEIVRDTDKDSDLDRDKEWRFRNRLEPHAIFLLQGRGHPLEACIQQ
jgi:hypothetical protein